MRTKWAEGVVRLDVVAFDPRPEVYIAYDGLTGLSQRPILTDVVQELQRQGSEPFARFVDALKRHRSGQVYIYFSDYVSYGIGGGDATAEFFFGSFPLLYYPRQTAADGTAIPEHLALRRPSGIEQVALEGPSS